MITLDLTTDQEEALKEQAAAQGVPVDAYVVQVLAQHCELRHNKPADEETLRLRAEAVDRFMLMRSAPNAPTLNLPKGMTLREYIHEGHRY